MSRFAYVRYDTKAIAIQEGCKEVFKNLEDAIEQFPKSRESALALTKLEEAYMWVGKVIRNDQIARNGAAPTQEERTNS